MVRRYPFGRSRRLRGRRDFERVFADRCSAGDSRLVVYVHKNGLDAPRLGISVGKRVGNAVARNRLKRVIRESFRLSQHVIPPGLDIVCVGKPADDPCVESYKVSLLRLIGIAAKKLARR